MQVTAKRVGYVDRHVHRVKPASIGIAVISRRYSGSRVAGINTPRPETGHTTTAGVGACVRRAFAFALPSGDSSTNAGLPSTCWIL